MDSRLPADVWSEICRKSKFKEVRNIDLPECKDLLYEKIVNYIDPTVVQLLYALSEHNVYIAGGAALHYYTLIHSKEEVRPIKDFDLYFNSTETRPVMDELISLNAVARCVIRSDASFVERREWIFNRNTKSRQDIDLCPHNYRRINDLLSGFDLDICQVAFKIIPGPSNSIPRIRFYYTNRFLQAFTTKQFSVKMHGLIPDKLSVRINKYRQLGYQIKTINLAADDSYESRRRTHSAHSKKPSSELVSLIEKDHQYKNNIDDCY